MIGSIRILFYRIRETCVQRVPISARGCPFPSCPRVDTSRQGFYLRSIPHAHPSILILCSLRLTVVCGSVVVPGVAPGFLLPTRRDVELVNAGDSRRVSRIVLPHSSVQLAKAISRSETYNHFFTQLPPLPVLIFIAIIYTFPFP